MSNRYILDAHGNPQEEHDLFRWAHWYETADRTVAKSTINGAEISTVFLGLDHNFHEGRPLLFETMIFGGPHHEFQRRYHTREDAMDGHRWAEHLVRDEISAEFVD